MPRIGTSRCIAVFFVSLLVATPCYSQTGICCFDDATCQVMTEEECSAAGGVYWLEGEVCDPAYICESFLGACCYPPTWECFMLTEEECSQHEGYYWVFGGSCDPPP